MEVVMWGWTGRSSEERGHHQHDIEEFMFSDYVLCRELKECTREELEKYIITEGGIYARKRLWDRVVPEIVDLCLITEIKNCRVLSWMRW